MIGEIVDLTTISTEPLEEDREDNLFDDDCT
jgi:hypothetical protein